MSAPPPTPSPPTLARIASLPVGQLLRLQLRPLRPWPSTLDFWHSLTRSNLPIPSSNWPDLIGFNLLPLFPPPTPCAPGNTTRAILSLHSHCSVLVAASIYCVLAGRILVPPKKSLPLLTRVILSWTLCCDDSLLPRAQHSRPVRRQNPESLLLSSAEMIIRVLATFKIETVVTMPLCRA